MVCPLAVLGCVLLFVNLSVKALTVFAVWTVIGLLVYSAYGLRHSDLAKEREERRQVSSGSNPWVGKPTQGFQAAERCFLHDQGLGCQPRPFPSRFLAISTKPFSLNDLAGSFAVGPHLLTGYAQFPPGLEKFFKPLSRVDIVARAHKQSTAYPQALVSSVERQRL